ncbi:spore germination protein [Paenibacillus sp. UNC496MF]|uniref:spore germination protein n=1 Tax=Paenibacillus sp. UNC496MF TaxID=1502753 RepID=UPI000B85FA2D|nr:spore germination protein [Paenibacillus sp. UNC496MF]
MEKGAAALKAGDQAVERLKQELGTSPDFNCQPVPIGGETAVYCLYLASITQCAMIEEQILKPLLEARTRLAGEPALDPERLSDYIPIARKSLGGGVREAAKNLLDGQCLLLTAGTAAFLSCDVARSDYRAVAEPETEAVIRGPREGFVEDLQVNMALIRKRLKTPHLVFEPFVIGTETATNVYMAYLSNVANDAVVGEFRRRIEAVRTDGILESAYIEEWIQDKTLSPFPQLASTERPDAVAAKLLEGHVAVLVDGSPMALAGPLTFFQLFSSPEDYYQRADIATLLRWLRMFAFVLSIFVPSLYIAIVSYHQELLPTQLLISLAAQREEVPFPAVIEALIMFITFEILREAGLRMPRIAGQAISIVGALVIGQAAVEAGFVTAAMVIIVSLTAISNYISPMYGFGIAQRIVQFVFMLLAGVMGLFGLLCGVFVLFIHLVSIRSFGVHYMAPLAPMMPSDFKDTLVRLPRKFMRGQPREFKAKNNTR